MIWGNDFVWLHFPKCAGTKTESIFRRYLADRPDIFQDTVDIKVDPKATWHHSLAERQRRDPSFAIGDRVIVCPFRRLPSWVMSRYSFEVARSPHLDHRPERLLTGNFLYANGREGNADQVASRYLPDEVLSSPRLVFIRMECFEADFRRVFAPFVDVDRIPPSEFAVRENSVPDRVPPEVARRLWSELEELYRHCPLWARAERKAYGSCLADGN